MTELPLEPNREILDALSVWIPEHLVEVRMCGATSSFLRSLVISMISDALAKGIVIDRTNEDGPMSEWDGWLVIYRKPATTYIKTIYERPKRASQRNPSAKCEMVEKP